MRLASLFAGIGLIIAVSFGLAQPKDEKDPYAKFLPKTGARTPAEEQKAFRLPPGFEIQLVASEPDINKPTNICFDDRGRLWVASTVEYPFPAKGPKTRDRLVVLEDFAENGKARKVTTFADNLNIPIGVMPLKDSAIVYSIPNIWKMTDTNGDGVADKREILYGTFGFNDTHGMSNSYTWGFDGWIYGCHGFHNTSTVKGKDGRAVVFTSGNTYRMKADGSRIEYFTHGQVNPFGLCFDPLGNLYSADCHSQPVYMLLRGADYPHFGKMADSFGFGPQMCFQDHGSTAIAGVVYYAADQFPSEYRNTIFIGNCLTNRINHDKLEKHGSTYKSVLQKDFLIGDDPWFRPVDIKLGPDGALYIADFYNAIIGHYEFPLTHPARDKERGRIWRIVYRGPDGKIPHPRRDWSEALLGRLVLGLGHPNLTVRIMVANQLAAYTGEKATEVSARLEPLVRSSSNPLQRIHSLWVLERLRLLDDGLLKTTAEDTEAMVRVHAIRILSEREKLSEPLSQVLISGLKDTDAFVRRAAADALSRHRAVANIRPLLALRHGVPSDDTHLLHVVRMAVRDQLRDASAWKDLPTANEQDAHAIADAAAGVPSPESARFLVQHIAGRTESDGKLGQYVRHIARYADASGETALLAFIRGRPADNFRQQVILAKAVQQGTQERGGSLSPATHDWIEQLTAQLLRSGDRGRLQAGLDLAGSLKSKSTRDSLLALVSKRDLPEGQRRSAITALVSIDPSKELSLLAQMLRDGGEPMAIREHLANQMAGVNQPAAHEELVKAIATAPKRLQVAIATGMVRTPAGAEKLLDGVAAGRVPARLLQDLPPIVQLLWANNASYTKSRERFKELTRDLPPADEKIQQLFNRRVSGFARAKADAELGAKIFEKNCAICHQLANKGARYGPQLDGVGIRGPERLIEDLLDPNRNVDQAFRASTLELKNGQVFSGLLVREEGEVLVFADNQGKEVRITKGEVAQRAVSMLSPMPINMVDQIPEKDFYDLLGFLLKQKPPERPMTNAK